MHFDMKSTILCLSILLTSAVMSAQQPSQSWNPDRGIFMVKAKGFIDPCPFWGMGGENLNYGDKDEIPYTEMR